jgi:DNA-binding FadR family transcriptional regulator
LIKPQSVKLPRFYQQVAEQLVDLIAPDKYTVGMRLAVDRDLAATLRLTIREAVIDLELECFGDV